MKRSELKAIIKECVRETLFEEGVLSEMIAEVAYGLTRAQNLMVESKPQQTQVQNTQAQQQLEEERNEARRKKLLETKRKMLDAMGDKKMSKVFEGTEPLSSAGNPNAQASPQGPLAGRDPNDAGIDISGLFSLAGQKWNQLK
tara:strand:- start:1249 stop:1677 length:429 start_codon:yes stop_codon:yes gene_type:complete